MIKGVHHVGVTVGSLEKAIDAWGQFANAEVVSRFRLEDSAAARAVTGLPVVSAKAAILKGPNAYIELFEFDGPVSPPVEARPVNAVGHTHVCVQSKDLTGLRAKFEAAGVKFFSPPVALGTGFLYAYGRDDDGAVYEQEAAPILPEQPYCWLGHVAFATPDLDRLTTFYRELTGARQTGRGRLGKNPLYDQVTGLEGADVEVTWLHPSNLTLEFWRFHNPPTTPRETLRPLNQLGYSHICLEVDDVAAERARAIALGASAQGEVLSTASAVLCYLRDPDGNLLELVSWRGEAEHLSIDRLADADILPRILERHFARQPKH